MAVCIAEVAASGSLNPTEVAQRFLDWFASDPSDVGIQTRGVLSSATSAGDVSVRAAERFARLPDRCAGNGSLMRTAPVALAHLGDDDAIIASANEISALTHADPVAGEACAIWCIAIDRAVREARIDGVWDGVDLLPASSQQRWTDWLHEAETRLPTTFNPNGYVVTALQAAWAAIRQTAAASEPRCIHFQRALHAAVRVGDDTDTVAAIAGSLLGARWGSTAVPISWRALLHGWPGYRATDLIRLAVLAANRGMVDDLGWPSAPDVTDWYVTNYDIQPFAVPLPDDPGVVLGNSVSAMTTDADVMLSLCRMGTERAPGVGEVHELMVVDSPRREHNPNLDFVLRDAATSIAAWRDQGRTVFVHCAAGISRTSAVAAAYLAQRRGISGLEALALVTAAHPVADPNSGFLEALARLQPAQVR